MAELYPEIEPFDSGTQKVSELHTIYWERVGNPKGIPVVFLHGGPGGGLIPTYRQFFDPSAYHVVLFDQRFGTVDATRRASREYDVGPDRRYRNIARKVQHRQVARIWRFVGLDLEPRVCCEPSGSMPWVDIARIFLTRKKELQWFYQYGASEIFPDYWGAIAKRYQRTSAAT